MIHNLKQTIGKLNTEQIKMEGEKQTQNERIRYLHARSQALEQDKEFLQNQIIESKRQNKLLKLAIGRLQNELDKKDEVITQINQPPPFSINNALSQAGEDRVGNTFITEAKGEKPLTGVMPLEGSADEHPTQEATEIKVMNSNEHAEQSSAV